MGDGAVRVAPQAANRYWLIVALISVCGLVWLLGSLVTSEAWGSLMLDIRAVQRDLHERLAEAMRAVKEREVAAASGLIVLSFLYGLFHAAGPGHGKAVLTAYLLTHDRRMRRGLWLAAGSSLCQGITAIVLVYGLILLAGWAARETQGAVAWAERLSFALVALLGGALALRSALAMVRARRAHRAAHHAHDGHAHCAAGCGHSHGPTPEQVESARDLRTGIGVILSIGLRPCSGAVLVLVFAHVLQIPWAGVAAVMAMSVGTGIAVSGLAAVAVGLRRLSLAFGRSMGRGLGVALNGAALLGGAAICWIGVSLFASSFTQPHPLGF